MAATPFTCGLRRALVALLTLCALLLVCPSLAFAGNGGGNDNPGGNGNGGANGNGCSANGNANGHTDCPDTPPPPPPPPPPPDPGAETGQPDPQDPAGPDESDPTAVDPGSSGDAGASADSGSTEEPSSGSTSDGSSSSGASPPGATGGSSGEPDGSGAGTTGGDTGADSGGDSGAASSGAPAPPAAGAPTWTPVGSAPIAEKTRPAPQPAAASSHTRSYEPSPSSYRPPARPAADRTPAQYGVAGRGAVITIRRRAGVLGGLSFRIAVARGSSSFVFRAARTVVASSGGRLYRIGTWLRTGVPGLTVCLRIQEVSPVDPLTAVRTSETCLAPSAKWQRFRLYRRTLARGNRLVFSIYSFGASRGDSFDVDRFTVARRIRHGWKRVDAAFRTDTSF